MQKDINQFISKGVKEKVDNLALQGIIKLIEENKLGVEELYHINLGVCEFCNKQFIGLEFEGEKLFNRDLCVNCDKPIRERLVVYTYMEDTEVEQIICLESEAEEVTKKYLAGKTE